jgi:hypothetical protein
VQEGAAGSSSRGAAQGAAAEAAAMVSLISRGVRQGFMFTALQPLARVHSWVCCNSSSSSSSISGSVCPG